MSAPAYAGISWGNNRDAASSFPFTSPLNTELSVHRFIPKPPLVPRIMAVLESIFHPPLLSAIILLSIASYIIYWRYLHPLSQYPGPFLASLTDLWQVYQYTTLRQPYHLTALHERYGPVVRYGPDKISVTHESAIPLTYQNGARAMPKTEFYDAYGAAHPNIFGMRDENVCK